MKISYSFHLGSKGNTIASKNDLKKVNNHNSRNYKDSNKIKHDEIIQIIGTKNIYGDVTKLYDAEFNSAVEKFNNTKGRKSRDKIENYMDKISEEKQKSVAEEIIIGFGKKDFWEKLNFDKNEMTEVFKKQITEFQIIYPNFKIANATLHYDEASPHIHIVGVPIKFGAKRGLENQVSKSSVFSRESLTDGQEKLRARFIEDIKKIKITDKDNKNISKDLELGEKEKGRNFNYSLEDYKNLQDKDKKIVKLEKELDEREEEINIVAANLKAIEAHKERELKQITKERELLIRQRAALEIENVDVLKKLKDQQEKDLKAKQLKKEEDGKKKELMASKTTLLQQIQLNELIEKATNKIIEPPEEMFLIFNKHPNHNSLQSYSSSLVNLIDEKIKEPITDLFVVGVQKVIDATAKVIFKAFNNMINLASNIGNQLANKTKELTTVTNSIINKNTELTAITNSITNKNKKLEDVNKAIENNNGELNTMIDNGIDDILAGKRKKLIYGDDLDEHINLIFDDLRRNIPYGNEIIKVSNYEYAFKYPEYAKQLSPLMKTMNNALNALKNNEGFEVEYSVEDIDKFQDYYDEHTR